MLYMSSIMWWSTRSLSRLWRTSYTNIYSHNGNVWGIVSWNKLLCSRKEIGCGGDRKEIGVTEGINL